MAARIERLDRRQLLSAEFPADRYSSINDTYDLTIGTAVVAAPLTSISWGDDSGISTTNNVTTFSPSVGDFSFTLPAGAAATKLVQLQLLGMHSATAVIRELDAAGTVRASWTLNDATVSGISFSSGADTHPVYSASLHFVSFATLFNQLASNESIVSTTTASFNTATKAGTSSAFLNSNLATTTLAAADTIEFMHGQIPVSSFTIGTGDSPPSVSGASFNTTGSLDSPTFLGAVLRGIAVPNVVYTQRDASMRAQTRWREESVYFSSFSVSDSVGDALPQTISISYTGRRVGVTNYTYDSSGIMQTPTSAGINLDTVAAYDPVGASAYILGPASGSRNTTRDSVEFRFSQAVSGLTLASFNYDNLTTAGLTLTPSAGNTIWTITGLSAQQAVDGHYAVKLLVVSPTLSAGLIGSAAVSWDLDRSAPNIVAKTFAYSVAAPSAYGFDFALNEPVTATTATTPLLIRRADTGVLVATLSANLDSTGTHLIGNAATPFADGRYIATLPGGAVQDLAGNLLASDTALPFFTLAGDADHNGTVDFNDLLTLAKNYGKTGLTFAQGNFNYDAAGKVDFDDLLILAKGYGSSVPLAAAAVATPTRAKRVATDVLD